MMSEAVVAEPGGGPMGQFEATTSAESGRVVVALSGECDLLVQTELTDVLLAAAGAAPVVLVDLEALTFLDSSGIHGLVTAYQAVLDQGGQFYLANATGVVADVLELTGVGDLMRPPAGFDVARPA
jgi:anti-anti-sigma factor